MVFSLIGNIKKICLVFLSKNQIEHKMLTPSGKEKMKEAWKQIKNRTDKKHFSKNFIETKRH
jgi:hypothetical protein